MKYFCETESGETTHFFISSVKPSNNNIDAYCLKDDDSKIFDLEKNITILNSSGFKTATHNLLFIYMLLSELCVDELAKAKFSDKASIIASKHINSIPFENEMRT
jgi:hypothetical protein